MKKVGSYSTKLVLVLSIQNFNRKVIKKGKCSQILLKFWKFLKYSPCINSSPALPNLKEPTFPLWEYTTLPPCSLHLWKTLLPFQTLYKSGFFLIANATSLFHHQVSERLRLSFVWSHISLAVSTISPFHSSQHSALSPPIKTLLGKILNFLTSFNFQILNRLWSFFLRRETFLNNVHNQ